MGNCLSDITIKDDDFARFNPRSQATHRVVNPTSIVQLSKFHTAVSDSDPLLAAEKMMQVQFQDNGIEALNRVEKLEKSKLIGMNAKTKLRANAGIEEQADEVMVEDFD